MAFFQCNCFSETLGLSVSFNAVIPQATTKQIGMNVRGGKVPFPVLYLLHGLSDDHTVWMRRTSIERYVAPVGLAVIMPAAGRSFYTDMRHGPAYWTYISQELPELVTSFFPVSRKREDTFVAGLSMGGYGALKLALTYPDRFAAAASLSGVLDLASHLSSSDNIFQRDSDLIFGKNVSVKGTSDDLYCLLPKNTEALFPRLYIACGTDDILYRENCAFRDQAIGLHYDVTWQEEKAGHTWDYWDRQIRDVVEWVSGLENRG